MLIDIYVKSYLLTFNDWISMHPNYIFSRDIAGFIHWIKVISFTGCYFSHCEYIKPDIFAVWKNKLSWRHVMYWMQCLRFEVTFSKTKESRWIWNLFHSWDMILLIYQKSCFTRKINFIYSMQRQTIAYDHFQFRFCVCKRNKSEYFFHIVPFQSWVDF